MIDKLVFLVGAPRSGTTWLQLMLSDAPEIVTANETHLFSEYMQSLFSSWSGFRHSSRELGLHQFMSETDFAGLLHAFASGVLAHVAARKPGATILLEKTPDHVMSWQVILRLFPQAHFVHIVRDPRAVVASLQAAHSSWGTAWVPPRISGQCRVWRRYVASGHSIGNATPRFLELRYEDVLGNTREKLQSIFAWLGIERSDAESEEIVRRYRIENLRTPSVSTSAWDLSKEPVDFFRRGAAESWETELTAAEILLVERMTGDLMAQFGYERHSRASIATRIVHAPLLRAADNIRSKLLRRTNQIAKRLR